LRDTCPLHDLTTSPIIIDIGAKVIGRDEVRDGLIYSSGLRGAGDKRASNSWRREAGEDVVIQAEED